MQWRSKVIKNYTNHKSKCQCSGGHSTLIVSLQKQLSADAVAVKGHKYVVPNIKYIPLYFGLEICGSEYKIQGVYLVLVEFVCWSALMRTAKSVEVTGEVSVIDIVSSCLVNFKQV